MPATLWFKVHDYRVHYNTVSKLKRNLKMLDFDVEHIGIIDFDALQLRMIYCIGMLSYTLYCVPILCEKKVNKKKHMQAMVIFMYTLYEKENNKWQRARIIIRQVTSISSSCPWPCLKGIISAYIPALHAVYLCVCVCHKM